MLSAATFRRLAFLTASFAYLQIALGGVVRVTDSGLGCPDWPLCHGRPYPAADIHSIIEYSHRTVGTITGVLLIVTVVMSWLVFRRTRPLVAWLATASVLAIAAEGALGGVVVVNELASWLVVVHLALAMIILGFLIATAVVSLPSTSAVADASFRRLAALAAAGTSRSPRWSGRGCCRSRSWLFREATAVSPCHGSRWTNTRHEYGARLPEPSQAAGCLAARRHRGRSDVPRGPWQSESRQRGGGPPGRHLGSRRSPRDQLLVRPRHRRRDVSHPPPSSAERPHPRLARPRDRHRAEHPRLRCPVGRGQPACGVTGAGGLADLRLCVHNVAQALHAAP